MGKYNLENQAAYLLEHNLLGATTFEELERLETVAFCWCARHDHGDYLGGESSLLGTHRPTTRQAQSIYSRKVPKEEAKGLTYCRKGLQFIGLSVVFIELCLIKY